eukprot:6715-Heterococcus_DN1.PRE.2
MRLQRKERERYSESGGVPVRCTQSVRALQLAKLFARSSTPDSSHYTHSSASGFVIMEGPAGELR